MTRRVPWIVAAGVLLAAAVAVVWMLASHSSPERGGAARRAPPDALGSAQPGPGEAHAVPPSDAGRERVPAGAAVTTENAPPASSWAKVFLVGALRMPPDATGEVTLLVRPGSRKETRLGVGVARAAWGKPDSDGGFRLDVSSAYPEGMERFPQILTLQVLRDAVRPTEVEIPVAVDQALLARGGEVELVAGEVVVRQACTLRGSAWAPDDPTSTVEVAAFELVDGVPRPSPAATASTSAETRSFELSLECDRDYAVLAFLEGYRPATRVVRDGALAPLQMALERGVAIRGRAALGERAVEATVSARIAGVGAELPCPMVNGTLFAWTDGSFEWLLRSARTRSDGSFGLFGLAPADYELGLGAVPGVHRAATKIASVRAPDDAVELAPEVCELHLTVTSGGVRAAHALLAISEVLADGSARASSTRTDIRGEVTLWLEPGSTLTINGSREYVFTCPVAGTRTTARIGD